nr:ATP-dependent RNA helicase DDX51/DBP6 [Cryptococcus depauperatus CBS 7855]
MSGNHISFEDPSRQDIYNAQNTSIELETEAALIKRKHKPESQKRRDKKKVEKRKKILKAKKAAAPKNKKWKPDPVIEAFKQAALSQPANQTKNKIRLDTPEAKAEVEVSEQLESKIEDDIDEKEKRLKEKREKRERKERKEERRAKREARRAADTVIQGSVPDAVNPLSQDININSNSGSEGHEVEPKIPQTPASPPPLKAFPLPHAAPLPPASVLAKQGLPRGLEDATFIDQSLSVSVDDFEMERKEEVQAAILPYLLPLRLVPLPYSTLHDYLISAPTGSGKTLTYAIPIIEILSQRTVTRLRALIVLPTRDLVMQVRETMEILTRGTGLIIGTATGQHSLNQERKQLVADLDISLLGGSSRLDILIATPGRLIDHLSSTPNFTLQHLRFLVIDEADRLLNQSFQDWLAQVLAYIRPSINTATPSSARQPYDAVAPAWMESFGLTDGSEEWYDSATYTCQKLLFSATLTRDPSKIAALSLNHPKYYIVQSSSAPALPTSIGEQFALPKSLSEKMLILPPALKPLNLIHLIHDPAYNVDKALVFTKSVENATRLVRLLEFFEDAYILGGGGRTRIVARHYTSELKTKEKTKLFTDFKEGKINLVVCSDLIARGIDLPAVSHVVSYDIPLDFRKYVHRVGRTARAGREGTAWTLVEKQEALHFKRILENAGHLNVVKKVKVKEEDLASYKESYEAGFILSLYLIAMKRLKEIYSREGQE